MSDSAADQTDKLTPAEESRVSAALALGAEQEAAQAAQSTSTEPPPVEVAQSSSTTAGVETPLDGERAAAAPGDAPLAGSSEQPAAAEPTIIESKPQPFDIDKTVLIEHPVQGLAVEREQPIPPAEAEPIKGTEVSGVAATTESAGTDEIEDHTEHPRDTIARLRAKLDAYGSECLKAVQPEIEYLISLCDF